MEAIIIYHRLNNGLEKIEKYYYSFLLVLQAVHDV